MNRQRLVHKVVIGLLLGTSALSCFGDRTSVVAPFGPPSYNSLVSLAVRSLPRGDVATAVFAVPAADSAVVVTLAGLQRLGGTSVYKVWLTDSLGATFVPAAGRIIHVQVDTVQGSLGDSAVTTKDTTTVGLQLAVRGGDGGTSDTVRILKSQLGNNPRTLTHHFVVVSIESDSLAATPSTAMPLWLRFRAPGATGALSFGNFNQAASLAFNFTAAGSGSVGYRGNEVESDVVQLARPPVGYYYRSWLVVATGTQVTAWGGVGGLTAPYPRSATSLDDADVNQSDPVVLPYAIYQARARAFAENILVTPGDTALSPDATGSGWFRAINYFAITLEPKAGTGGIGPTQILKATAPDIVYNP